MGYIQRTCYRLWFRWNLKLNCLVRHQSLQWAKLLYWCTTLSHCSDSHSLVHTFQLELLSSIKLLPPTQKIKWESLLNISSLKLHPLLQKKNAKNIHMQFISLKPYFKKIVHLYRKKKKKLRKKDEGEHSTLCPSLCFPLCLPPGMLSWVPTQLVQQPEIPTFPLSLYSASRIAQSDVDWSAPSQSISLIRPEVLHREEGDELGFQISRPLDHLRRHWQLSTPGGKYSGERGGGQEGGQGVVC